MGIAALILGILALCSCCAHLVIDISAAISGIAALVLGIVGLILGIIAVRRAEKRGAAIAGLALSIIALIVAISMMTLIVIGINTIMGDPALQEQSGQPAQQITDAPESVAPTAAMPTIAATAVATTAAPTTVAPATTVPATATP